MFSYVAVELNRLSLGWYGDFDFQKSILLIKEHELNSSILSFVTNNTNLSVSIYYGIRLRFKLPYSFVFAPMKPSI